MKKNIIKSWPVEEGRYKVGHPQACVAVCTEATVEGITVDMTKVAIIGKCVTENIGIEKIVKNIVSNPNIRFLILCGKKSHGHDVGQTIISLVNNGADKDNKIIGATGSIPVVKHLSNDEISRFRKQIQTVDMQGIIDSREIQFRVEQLIKKDPGAFNGKAVKIKKLKGEDKIKCIKALENKKFISDPHGSFRITIDKEAGEIICRHYNNNLELNTQITGKDAKSICETIIREKLIGNFADSLVHISYLGRELYKAEVCLLNNLEYVQDEPLVITHVKSHASLVKDDEFGWS